jgi:hypothetical protein
MDQISLSPTTKLLRRSAGGVRFPLCTQFHRAHKQVIGVKISLKRRIVIFDKMRLANQNIERRSHARILNPCFANRLARSREGYQ